jgi:LacI family transcriptional regulator
VTAERGLSIPGDLSILCYEDAPWFEWHRPALSVIDSGARDLANLAVDRLLQRMKAKNRHAEGGIAEGAREYRVGARLVKRDSCAAFDPPSTHSLSLKA